MGGRTALRALAAIVVCLVVFFVFRSERITLGPVLLSVAAAALTWWLFPRIVKAG